MIQVVETICDSCGTPAWCYRLPVHNTGNLVYDYCNQCVGPWARDNWTEYIYRHAGRALFAANCTRSDSCDYFKVLELNDDNMAMIRNQMSAHGKASRHRWAS